MSIPDTVTSIGNRAFAYCTSLTDVTIPSSVTSISQLAFFYCTSLSSVVLSEGLTTIGSGAFEYCYALSEITIPSSVTSIVSYAFYGSAVSSVTFEGDAPSSFGSEVFTETVTIYYYSSYSGWDDAQSDWSLPDGSAFVDMDSMIDPDVFAFESSSYTVNVGETITVSTNADDYTKTLIYYSSSDLKTASVMQSGAVTGVSEGSVIITAASEDGTYSAACTVTVVNADTSELTNAKTTLTDGVTVTNNVSDNNYTTYYANTVESYLYENSDGTFTRVEYYSSELIIETYSSDLVLEDSQTISRPDDMSLWGGFYSGETYNFVVFGQSNTSEDDSVTVLRVYKYDKSWNEISSCDISAANTYVPFDAGSLRMTETNGSLYIHTCHTMYEVDGANHQANMTLVINESSMTLTQSNYEISNNSTGYVSHSFDQYIVTDGTYIYRIDLGDAYPRGIFLTKSSVSSITNVSGTEAYSILGTTGANRTGVSLGGLELSSENIIIAFNSVDMSSSSSYSASGTRNIYISVSDQDLSSSNTIQITDYSSSDGITVRTPQLVKISDDVFLLMWEESASTVTTQAVLINGEGEMISDIETLCVRLSDCQPILSSDGLVTWYVTDGSSVTFYQISPYRLSESKELVHSYDDGTVTEAATCTTDGVLTYTCSVCGETKTKTIPATGHDYDYNNVSWTWAADYSSATAAVTCKNDPDHVIEVSADVSSVTTAAVCETAGQIVYTAEAVFSGSGTYTDTETVVLAALGHSWDSGTVTTAATCTSAGVLTYTCENDSSHTYTETIAALGHTAGTVVTENSVAATCTEAGSYDSVVYCTVCGEELSRETVTVAALGHSWDDGVVTTEPTCTEAGVLTYTCENDSSHTYTETIAALGHTAGTAVTENSIAATCTEAGSYDSVVYCTVCGEELSRETITVAATGHNWTSVTVSAGSYGSTKTTYTCSACGKEKTVTSLYGSDRYKTASDIVANTFESCTYAVIADGSNFPDALAAASLAGAVDAPILITSDSRIQDTIEELKSLGVTYVYIVGGTSSVSAGAMSAIEAEGIEVERIAGDTRQLTAVAVAEKVLSITGTSDVCLVATGKTYADALAASPYAYWSASPIYLTKNDGSISDEVLASIKAAGYSRIIILGGTSSVTEATEETLSEIASVTRLGGDTRYETAEAIAAWSVEQGMSYNGLTVATGTNYPDALTASALCGKNGSVLLLSAATTEASTVLEEVIDANADDISDIYIVGGYSSVSEEIREMITDALK